MPTRWTRKPTQIDLSNRIARLEQAVWDVARESGLAMEAQAKTNAPWSDDTGLARAGLRAVTERNGDVISISLCHSVEYGPYLELARGGKYAILQPTIDRELPQLRAALERLAGQ